MISKFCDNTIGKSQPPCKNTTLAKIAKTNPKTRFNFSGNTNAYV